MGDCTQWNLSKTIKAHKVFWWRAEVINNWTDSRERSLLPIREGLRDSWKEWLIHMQFLLGLAGLQLTDCNSLPLTWHLERKINMKVINLGVIDNCIQFSKFIQFSKLERENVEVSSTCKSRLVVCGCSRGLTCLPPCFPHPCLVFIVFLIPTSQHAGQVDALDSVCMK